MLFEQLIPVKYNAINVLFATKVIEIMFKVIKPFLSEQLQNAFRFHGSDLQPLMNELGSDRIPTIIGGNWEMSLPVDDELKAMDDKLIDYWTRYDLIQSSNDD